MIKRTYYQPHKSVAALVEPEIRALVAALERHVRAAILLELEAKAAELAAGAAPRRRRT
jgi:hypothetical protein